MEAPKLAGSAIVDIIFKVVMFLWATVSPQLKELLTNQAKALYVAAKKTPNPADNIFAEMFLRVLGIDPVTVE